MADTYITCREENGSINISEEVITDIVRAAVAEAEGVAGLSNSISGELAELIDKRSLTKGVRVQFADGQIVVDAVITVRFGNSIMTVAKNVQDKVLSVIQATTGFENARINVHVSGIVFDK